MFHLALIEDSPAEARLLQHALRQTGIPVEVRVLRDGIEAVDYFTAGASGCDLVLLDLNLPKLGGIEVLEHIRAQAECRALPVIVLSGSSDPADVERCYRAGANSYICKPIHLDEILVMAGQLLTYWCRCVTIPAQRLTNATALG